mgnify:CR=1 FL=1
MLDIKFVRENPEAVKENIRKKFQEQKLPLVDEVLELDGKDRAAIYGSSWQKGAFWDALGILDRLKDKEHKYFRCPKCRQTVRVPKGKGRVRITCKSCGNASLTSCSIKWNCSSS